MIPVEIDKVNTIEKTPSIEKLIGLCEKIGQVRADMYHNYDEDNLKILRYHLAQPAGAEATTKFSDFIEKFYEDIIRRKNEG